MNLFDQEIKSRVKSGWGRGAGRQKEAAAQKKIAKNKCLIVCLLVAQGLDVSLSTDTVAFYD